MLDEIKIEDIPSILPLLSQPEQELLLAELEKLENLKKRKAAQDHFMPFVKEVWPTFISGRHHAVMAEAFERVAKGTLKRLIINMPPRHTKSEFASYLLPAWFLGKYPQKKIIQTSHTAELAVGFGRKVRNLFDTDIFHELFPGVALQADSKAAGRWQTNKGGDYFAIGVGGAVTGKGADVLIIDDPHSEQEAALAEINPDIYDKTYEWYTSGPRQRLQPGGAIVIVMCMVGDTAVLRPDGSETPLKDIRSGDMVATYEGGALTAARVNNWQSSGVDDIYAVQTRSNRVLKANARHPFLVRRKGREEWVRVEDLTTGDMLVAPKGACVPQDRKRNRGYAKRASPKRATTGKTLTPPVAQWDIMGSGRERNALAVSRSIVRAFASHVTERNTRLLNRPPSKTERDALSTATASALSNITRWWKNVTIGATCAVRSLTATTPVPIGAVSYASTTATTPARYAGYYATTATSRSGTGKRRKPSRVGRNTLDAIVSINPAGREEVFDVEVDRTENFIANGVVSHNTRWSKRDLTGQVLKSSMQRGGNEWEVIEFPAIMPSGKPLWPEFWPMEELSALKTELPNSKWMAQYQQNPTSDQSAIIKREWWQEWPHDDPPHCDFTLQSWDTAFEKTQRADYSALTMWGVFYKEDATGTKQPNIILLNAFRERMEFPRLKQVAIQHYNDWEPDGVIIEKKASGAPLIYELRAMGLPVQEYTPTRGNDKISRLNAVADIFASGRVWAPATHWAEEVIDEVAEFPAGSHDDYVDSLSLAMMRFRQGGYVTTLLDEDEEQMYFKGRSARRGYY